MPGSTNLKRITTYVEPEIYEVIEKQAKLENRTISNMAATLLAWATGQLPTGEEDQPNSK